MLKTRPQKPFSPTPILQLLAHMSHEIPFGFFGGFGGKPNVSRLSACALSVILSACSGFSRMHCKQTPRRLEISFDCLPQIWHRPNKVHQENLGTNLFLRCYFVSSRRDKPI